MCINVTLCCTCDHLNHSNIQRCISKQTKISAFRCYQECVPQLPRWPLGICGASRFDCLAYSSSDLKPSHSSQPPHHLTGLKSGAVGKPQMQLTPLEVRVVTAKLM